MKGFISNLAFSDSVQPWGLPTHGTTTDDIYSYLGIVITAQYVLDEN
jgi:hypothetical protein